MCGLGRSFGIITGPKHIGKNNQSILSTFIISNEMLAEMRRVMATKTTVTLDGTRFNIFNLVKFIQKMKTQNEMYNDNVADLQKKDDVEIGGDERDSD